MIHTRSRSTAQPPGKNNSQPHPKPPPNQKQETVSKPKAKPKLTPKIPAQDIETAASEEPEACAPVKNSKKRKASQTPAPMAELGNSDRTPPEPVSKHRNILTMPPRDPLPDRGTNRQDIGGPDRPRYKRTTAQVQEDANRREQVQQKLDDLEAAKLRLLAEMEIQQEREDAEEEALAVRGFEDELLDENDAEADMSSENDSVVATAGSSKQRVCLFNLSKASSLTNKHG